jgi:putative oxidoreductase
VAPVLSQENPIMNTLVRLEHISAQLSKFDDASRFLPPLLARLTVGYAFVHSGWAKLHHLDKVGVFFASLGIPAPGFHAIFVSMTELVCGALVLVGLLTRVAAVPLMGTMVVAILTAKLGDVTDLNDFVGLIELTYLVLLAGLAHSGGGALSLDGLIFRGREGGSFQTGLSAGRREKAKFV